MSLTNAQRQKAYRDRAKLLSSSIEGLREAITAACELAHSPLVNNLPEEPNAWLLAITERLAGKALFAADRSQPRKRVRKRKTCPHCHLKLHVQEPGPSPRLETVLDQNVS